MESGSFLEFFFYSLFYVNINKTQQFKDKLIHQSFPVLGSLQNPMVFIITF